MCQAYFQGKRIRCFCLESMYLLIQSIPCIIIMDIGWAETPVGWARVETAGGFIHSFRFEEQVPAGAFREKTPAALLRASEAYCNNLTSLPFLALSGSAYQRQVWETLTHIPRGETRTYGDIAEIVAQPSHARAVARSCSQNVFAVLIPCHRVVGKTRIGGYRWGGGLKQALLEWEGRGGGSGPLVISFWTMDRKSS